MIKISKKFNIGGEEKKKKIKEFQEILQTIDKDSIMEAFRLGIEVGFWGKTKPNQDLYLQFNDGKEFVYTVIRMPIRHIKRSPTSPVSMSILNSKNIKGRKIT